MQRNCCGPESLSSKGCRRFQSDNCKSHGTVSPPPRNQLASRDAPSDCSAVNRSEDADDEKSGDELERGLPSIPNNDTFLNDDDSSSDDGEDLVALARKLAN